MNRVRLMLLTRTKELYHSLTAIVSSVKGFEVLGGFTDEEQRFWPELEQVQPDLIIYELGAMGDDVSSITILKKVCPCTKVIAFIKRDAPENVIPVLAAGVDAYLSGAMLPCHLARSVELVARAGVFCLPAALRNFLGTPHSKPEEGACEGEKTNSGGTKEDETATDLLPLTARETDVYKLLISNCSNKDIAERLYISEPTVKSHVSSIFRKLGLNNRADAIRF